MRAVVVVALLYAAPAFAQHPCPEQWSDVGTIVTPAHLQEIRACMDHLHETWSRRVVSTCREHWKREGDFEDQFLIPQCVKRFRFQAEALRYDTTFRIRAWDPEDEEWWTIRERNLATRGDRYDGYMRTYGATDLIVYIIKGNLSWRIDSVSSE